MDFPGIYLPPRHCYSMNHRVFESGSSRKLWDSKRLRASLPSTKRLRCGVKLVSESKAQDQSYGEEVRWTGANDTSSSKSRIEWI